MKSINNTPKGYQVAALHCGLKTENQKDLAVVFSESPCQVAAAFTTNKVKAAPVLYDQQIVQAGKAVRAVAVNAGNANACTGSEGMQHTRQIAEATSQLFAGNADEVLVLSTGVIGVPLPIDMVLTGIEEIKLQRSPQAWQDVARAMMTTDTRPKIISLQSPAGYTITGVAKGSGMISPNMATMLSVICTDAALTKEMLVKIPEIWNQTFNRIVVDGDMSTNDTVLLLANGASGVEVDPGSDFYETFFQLCTQLAKAIVQDGEGATKLITVNINGANSQDDAEKIARAIATSPLCKTAFYGADPNWGRIICAAGYANADFSPEKASLYLKGNDQVIKLFENGKSAAYDEEEAIALMQADTWEVSLELGLGESSYWLWTCDLSHEYITINGHYRT
ncbi:MAG: bifunctional glutamate N-acetyltransferase/amino-acid acetyltransferase ArgJ [Chloroflexota bacterium]